MRDLDALLAEYKRRDLFRLLGSGSLLTLPIPGAPTPIRLRQLEGNAEAIRHA